MAYRCSCSMYRMPSCGKLTPPGIKRRYIWPSAANGSEKDRQVTPELRRGGTWGFVNVAWLKGNLCSEGDGTSKHLNRDFMGEVCMWW